MNSLHAKQTGSWVSTVPSLPPVVASEQAAQRSCPTKLAFPYRWRWASRQQTGGNETRTRDRERERQAGMTRKAGLSATAKRRAQRAASRSTLVIVPGVTCGGADGADDRAALAAFMSDCGQRSQLLADKLAAEQRRHQQVQSQLRYERSAADAAEAAAEVAELARVAAEREAAAQVAAARLANEQLRERLVAEETARRQSERDLEQLQIRSAGIVDLERRAAEAERARAHAEAALERAEAAAEAARLAVIDERATREALECQLERQLSELAESAAEYSALLAASASTQEPEQPVETAEKQSDTQHGNADAPAAAILVGDSNGSDVVDEASSADGVSDSERETGRETEAAAQGERAAQPEPQDEYMPAPTSPRTRDQPSRATVASPGMERCTPMVADEQQKAQQHELQLQKVLQTEHERKQEQEQEQEQEHEHEHERVRAPPAPLSMAEAEHHRLNAMVADGLHKLLLAEGSARDALSLHTINRDKSAGCQQAGDQEPQWIKRTGGLLGKEERWTQRAPYGTRPARDHTRGPAPIPPTEMALYRLGAEVRQLWRQFDQQSNRPRRRVL